MKQKRYIDIENARFESDELKEANTGAFEVGDLVHVSEKIDGSSACLTYDNETSSLVAFSRNKQLDYQNTLNGFWNYAQSLDVEPFKLHPNWYVFGEWMGVFRKIKYDDSVKGKWLVYSIWNNLREAWLDQILVKDFCQRNGFEYIHTFYEGPFVSWEHVKSFLNQPHYGERIEGVVIRNRSKLNDPENHYPHILKIVNDDFKESMKPRVREVDPELEAEKAEAYALAESIVTRNRVEKMLYKMRDEGDLPEKISPQDMGTVAKLLPKRVYDDCVKEELEAVVRCGMYFGKICNTLSMKHARDILL